MNKRNRYSAVFLLLLYAAFFASTNFFFHIHQGPNYKIVHSHPWSGKTHDHSANEFQLIHFLTSGSYVVPEVQNIIEACLAYTRKQDVILPCSVLPHHRSMVVAGRAPPYSFS